MEESKEVVNRLMEIVKEISGFLDCRNTSKKLYSNLSRRMKLLSPLFEELKDSEEVLGDDDVRALLCMKIAFEAARDLLRSLPFVHTQKLREKGRGDFCLENRGGCDTLKPMRPPLKDVHFAKPGPFPSHGESISPEGTKADDHVAHFHRVGAIPHWLSWPTQGHKYSSSSSCVPKVSWLGGTQLDELSTECVPGSGSSCGRGKWPVSSPKMQRRGRIRLGLPSASGPLKRCTFL
ncbi:hypothetical protein Scep_022338 [Stephania cephalantha]|uniref:Uncharacterized protein n=1 Tax=Stephania cephalantha TaxID=152367 RepID=A0AAP0I2L2_9MAGN